MPRLHSSEPGKASLARRDVLATGAALFLTGCQRDAPITAAHTPKLDDDLLNRELGRLAERLRPARFGLGLMNLDSAEVYTLEGERAFPMQGVWKLALAAASMAEVDAGRLRLNEMLKVRDVDLSPPYSLVNETWPGRSAYTVRELLVDALGRSDNTAADVLAARIGGPGAISAWLQEKNLTEVRVDRYERDLQCDALGLPPFRPAWRTEAAFAEAARTVPAAQQRSALSTFLADPRDTATPAGMLHFLDLFSTNALVSRGSRNLLREIMLASPVGARRVRAGLPKGSLWAHKSGTGRPVLGVNPAANDVGVFTLPDRRRYALAVFVSDSPHSEAALDAAFAEAARIVVRGVR